MNNRRYTGRPSLKWLFEQAEPPAADAGSKEEAPNPDLAKEIEALWKLPYAQFVEKLKVVAKDKNLRAFLAAGRKDGQPGDEGVTVAAKTIAGSALSPTQSEIDLTNSVAWPFKNPGSIAAFYAGPWKGGDPIITAGGKWVIDGHHRWSSAMVFNPNVQLLCVDIDISDPEMALKMTQAAIATTKGNVPTQGVKEGMNVYSMGFNDIVDAFINGGTGATMNEIVVENLKGKLVVSASPEEIAQAKTTYEKAGGNKRAQATPEKPEVGYGPGNTNFGGMGSAQGSEGAIGGSYLTEATVGESGGDAFPEAAASLAHNCKALPAAGQFPRPIMPQTGTGDGGPGPAGLSKELQSGDINSKPGFDIVKEGVSFDLNRWQVLAGIKNRG